MKPIGGTSLILSMSTSHLPVASIILGIAVITGTHIPVSVIFNLLSHGYDFACIRTVYLDLSDEDIRAAIAYSEARVNWEPRS